MHESESPARSATSGRCRTEATGTMRHMVGGSIGREAVQENATSCDGPMPLDWVLKIALDVRDIVHGVHSASEQTKAQKCSRCTYQQRWVKDLLRKYDWRKNKDILDPLVRPHRLVKTAYAPPPWTLTARLDRTGDPR